MIWQFPQYTLGSAVLVDVADAAGFPGVPTAAAVAVMLLWAIAVSSIYGRSPIWIRRYERLLQTMVWAIVICFAWVVLRTGVPDWGALVRGSLAFEVPGERSGVAAVTLVLSGLSAAVGINMVFLYPYSLLARGWGREHRRLARADLTLGMFVPYAIAVSLVGIATANTIFLDPAYDGRRLSPVEAAQVLAGSWAGTSCSSTACNSRGPSPAGATRDPTRPRATLEVGRARREPAARAHSAKWASVMTVRMPLTAP